MDNKQILETVQEIFRDILDNENILLQEGTTADDVEEWDSLTHIQLVVAVEKSFKIKFTSREILSWTCIGDLIMCIASKLV